MRRTLTGVDAGRLERSCKRPADSIRFGQRTVGLESADVRIYGSGFETHRHDSYTIGMTTAGVQRFRYLGTRQTSLPGELVILYPDETHDGVPGTDDGFGYRAVYIAPELIIRATDGRALPFVAEPVQRAVPATRSIASVLADIDEPIDDLRSSAVVATIADCLWSLSGHLSSDGAPVDVTAVNIVREYLAAHARERIVAATLESIAGLDRFTIARHFRRAFGTSPDRYRTLRRLKLARSAIESGASLATAAAESGFADQSHMTRQFKQTYGFTPARWVALTAANHGNVPPVRLRRPM
jgi:AraC-like DNA-binding protein